MYFFFHSKNYSITEFLFKIKNLPSVFFPSEVLHANIPLPHEIYVMYYKTLQQVGPIKSTELHGHGQKVCDC